MQQEHLNQVSILTKFWSNSFFQIITPAAKYHALLKLKNSRIMKRKDELNLTPIFMI
jgi:hypothetical protein